MRHTYNVYVGLYVYVRSNAQRDETTGVRLLKIVMKVAIFMERRINFHKNVLTIIARKEAFSLFLFIWIRVIVIEEGADRRCQYIGDLNINVLRSTNACLSLRQQT